MATANQIDLALETSGYPFMFVRKCKHGFYIAPKVETLIIDTVSLGRSISNLSDSDVEQVISQINIDFESVEKHLAVVEATFEEECEKAKQALSSNQWDELEECASILANNERNIIFLKQVLESATKKVQVCAKCGTPVVFENVSPGYQAVCPKEDEDLFSFEIETKEVV